MASAANLEPKAGPAPIRITADQPIRVGLIGVGGRAHNLVDSTFANKANNVRIVAMADPDTLNMDKMSAKLAKLEAGKPDIYTGETDWRDKLLARQDVDTSHLDAGMGETPTRIRRLGCDRGLGREGRRGRGK